MGPTRPHRKRLQLRLLGDPRRIKFRRLLGRPERAAMISRPPPMVREEFVSEEGSRGLDHNTLVNSYRITTTTATTSTAAATTTAVFIPFRTPIAGNDGFKTPTNT